MVQRGIARHGMQVFDRGWRVRFSVIKVFFNYLPRSAHTVTALQRKESVMMQAVSFLNETTQRILMKFDVVGL